MHLYSAFRSEDTEAVVPAPWGKGGHVPPPPPPSPHFYEWLGTEGHHRRTFNYYNAVICQYNFTADGRTEIIFYLEIRTSVQEQAIARYSQ